MNKVILMGRLTRDVELRQTPSGVSVARFTIAVDRRYTKDGQRQTDFIDCTAWRQVGEFISRYFSKGRMIAVVGSIQTSSWDGQDGKKHYSTDVVVDEAYFTGSKSESGGSQGGYNNNYGNSYQNNNSQPVQQGASNSDSFGGFDDGFADIDSSEDDLPF